MTIVQDQKKRENTKKDQCKNLLGEFKLERQISPKPAQPKKYHLQKKMWHFHRKLINEG